MTNENNRILDNPIMTITNQINQVEKYRISSDLVELTYGHG